MNTWISRSACVLLLSVLAACGGGVEGGSGGKGGPAVTPAKFAQEVEQSKGLVLVDFWAPWCGPCRKMKPVFEKVERSYAGRVKFAKVDIDQSREVAEKYHIESIPNLVLFRDGKPVDQKVGLQTEAGLRAWLDAQLKSTTTNAAPAKGS